MSFRRVIVSVVGLGVLLVVGVAGAQQLQQPGAEAASLGITNDRVTRIGEGVRKVEAFGLSPTAIAVVQIDDSVPTNPQVAFQSSQGFFSFSFDRERAVFTIEDRDRGRASAQFDFQTGQWVPDAAAIAILGAHSAVFPLAVHAMVDTADRGIEPNTFYQDPGGEDGGGGGAPCTGEWFRGSGIGVARSIACSRASSDAASQCTNGQCWGCCAWLEGCDCIRLGSFVPPLRDYICQCNKSGQACGR